MKFRVFWDVVPCSQVDVDTTILSTKSRYMDRLIKEAIEIELYEQHEQ
jgi:hypothetical protein